MDIKSLSAAAFLVVASLTNVGCSTLAELKANAIADRAANPEKYQEIPEVARQQMTQNQGGAAYPQLCTWGCPQEQADLTRNW